MRGTMRWGKRFSVSLVALGLTAAACAMLVAGCGMFSRDRQEVKELYNGMAGPTGDFRKTVVILPIKNEVAWAHLDLNGLLGQPLKRDIEKKCSGVRVLMPDDPGFPARFNQPPYKDGGLDNMALAAAGQATGVNEVLAVRLVSIRYVTEDRGMLWFAKVVHLARLQIQVTVFHTGTAARLLDNAVFQDIEISEAEGKIIDARQIPNGLPVAEVLSQAADTLGGDICEVLKHIPWEGWITRVEGNRIVLSAGKASGLKAGKTLDVFSVQSVIEKRMGEHFFAPGQKIGRITVTAVYPDRSEAVIKSGGPIAPGSQVRAE